MTASSRMSRCSSSAKRAGSCSREAAVVHAAPVPDRGDNRAAGQFPAWLCKVQERPVLQPPHGQRAYRKGRAPGDPRSCGKKLFATYSEGGMRVWFIRSMLLLALPFVLVWSFISELISELFRGMRSAFWYAWQDVRIEYHSFTKLWDDAPYD
jgi:hypothetical protein